MGCHKGTPGDITFLWFKGSLCRGMDVCLFYGKDDWCVAAKILIIFEYHD